MGPIQIFGQNGRWCVDRGEEGSPNRGAMVGNKGRCWGRTGGIGEWVPEYLDGGVSGGGGAGREGEESRGRRKRGGGDRSKRGWLAS